MGEAVASDGFQPIACPFTGAPMLAVRAVAPDVAVAHVQRADRHGNLLRRLDPERVWTADA